MTRVQNHLLAFILLFFSFLLGASAAPTKAASFAAEPNQKTESIYLHRGEEKKMTLSWINSGDTTWQNEGQNPVRVAISKDKASLFYHSSWISQNRLTSLASPVAPLETASFSFTLKAPNQVGSFSEEIELVAEYLTWIPNSKVTLLIEVAGEGSAYRVLDKTESFKLVAGGTGQLFVEVKNTGTTTWQRGGENPVKLGTSAPNDRRSSFKHSSWLSDNRVVLLPQEQVAPGETVRWEFPISAPGKSGIYYENFNLVTEFVAWMPPGGISFSIEVGPALYRAKYQGQSPYPTLKPGETTTLWVDFENTGNVPWERDQEHPVRLGTAYPLDRKSLFEDSSWLTPDRPTALKQEKVLPGEIGRFEFVIKAPDKLGKYREYFRPVVEYLTWLPDAGLYWEIEVEQELVLKNPIRVGLTPTTEEAVIQTRGAFVIRDSGNNLIAKIEKGSARLSPNGLIRIETQGVNKITSLPIKAIPLNNSLLVVSSSGVSSTYNTFRGILRLERSSYSGRVWLMNDLELEDYLKGVAEMPPAWPPEALKAQAVVARTWAVRARSAPVADIFDLYDDTRSQVYFGYNYEAVNPGMGQAGEATGGLVVKYGGAYAATYYHSDSGGYTANVENVWADGAPERAVPYLVAVEDPYAKPVIWQAIITQDYIKERFDQELKNAGVYGEPVVNLAVSEAYPSGRVKTVVFTAGSNRSFSVGSRRFDYLTHNTLIKSMLFTIRKDAETSAPNFVFEGKGNGHGVGLSQWSAYNMATLGKNFDEIIKFFYRGVELIHE